MPISVHCNCGATFDVPDRFGGRSAHCIACGAAIDVPDPQAERADGVIPFADEPPPLPSDADPLWSQPVESQAVTAAPPPLPAPESPSHLADASERQLDPREPVSQPQRNAILAPEVSFWQDASRSLGLFTMPENAPACLVVWFLHLIWGTLSYVATTAVVAAGGFAVAVVPFMVLLKILIAGVLCSFYLNIILETARGEDKLPDLGIEGNPWDDIFRPLVLFVGSWAALMLPAFLLNYFDPGNTLIPNAAIVLAAVAVGVFLWPVTILTVAIGDSLWSLRPDLIVMTVVRTIIPYLAIWVILAVAFALVTVPVLAGDFGLLASTPVGRIPWTTWPAHAISSVLSGFLLIIIMRMCGLYYRHFKADFAWHAE